MGLPNWLRWMLGLTDADERAAMRVNAYLDRMGVNSDTRDKEQIYRDAIDDIFDGSFDRSKVEDALWRMREN